MELITYQHPGLLSVEVIGGKAHGLFRLKALERRLTDAISYPGHTTEAIVPPFFVVPVGSALDGRITEAAGKISKSNFAVRSSSPYEDGTDYSFDGRFETKLNIPLESLTPAIEEVCASALDEKARRYAEDFGLTIDDKMAVIVQEMVPNTSRLGIIYSKAPSLIEARKIELANAHNNKEIFIREKGLTGRIFTGIKRHLTYIEELLENCDSISDILENEWGCPVRIEFAKDGSTGLSYFYRLQCRPLTSPDQTQFSFVDTGRTFHQVAETSDVNMPGDVYYPLLNITRGSSENLPQREVRELDQKFSEGYVLMCNYLEFYRKNYDLDTSNKKAVIVTAPELMNPLTDHNADICRKNGIILLRLNDLNQLMGDGELDLKTGDMVRIKSDGIIGQFYKEV